MNTTALKASTFIEIDAGILSQIKEDAKSEHKSLSDYIESLLYRLGYRPYNEETLEALQEAREGRCEGVVDTTSRESIEASLFGEDEA